MEIIELKVMRGPNYWANYKKLNVLKLDIGNWEQMRAKKIEINPRKKKEDVI